MLVAGTVPYRHKPLYPKPAVYNEHTHLHPKRTLLHFQGTFGKCDPWRTKKYSWLVYMVSVDLLYSCLLIGTAVLGTSCYCSIQSHSPARPLLIPGDTALCISSQRNVLPLCCLADLKHQKSASCASWPNGIKHDSPCWLCLWFQTAHPSLEFSAFRKYRKCVSCKC